ncbi:yap-binding protein [Ophiostoma piceae UAMH 11346]|uniref:Yap-binding protein n=1 Tax=Ophiostoma piceae (strain UAMH 11346) TaxID=1262450 RepID=S3BPC2_OPHP1|nr:yap-binding protein [Ophiostoma piceae UAMH 11346]
MAQPSPAQSITTSSTNPNTLIAIQALLEARPPASDRFTYLTLIDEHLSPELLPTLHEVLQDASLTQELGWDLVDMLVPLLPASEACLDDVARLGNPREVILKVLEVLEHLRPSKQDDDDGDFEAGQDQDPELDPASDKPKVDAKEDEATTQTFVALLGMLALLHRRLKTKYPSRFLETTLRTILSAYQPDRPGMTTAVLGLVRSLATRRRPAPPIRRSDSQLSELALARTNSNTASPAAAAVASSTLEPDPAGSATTSAIGKVGADHVGRSDDSAVSVPDPEADDQVAPSEGAIQQRLLQSFLTCVIDAYVNANDMAWAPRLIEYYNPKKVVPGRPTQLHEFREIPVKIARDQSVSQMVALALDLGLKYSDALVADVSSSDDGSVNPVRRRPFAELSVDVSSQSVQDIPLSTGGVICLLAYWVFAADVFKADAAMPNLRMFPDHHAMIEKFLDGNAAVQITQTPGTVEALVAIGLWLDHHGLYSDSGVGAGDEFLPYHHSLTLCAAFHPSLLVRNAATSLAGAVLHANPDAEDRLKILQDLLENCMFSSLKACAVTWLREEIIAAAANDASATGSERTLFGGADAVEQLQYAIFPDLQELQVARASSSTASGDEDDDTALLEYWMQNSPFLLQAANFAYFLFCSDQLKGTVVPPGMGPAIEQRYVEPLLQAAKRLGKLLGDGADGHAHDHEKEKEAETASPFQHITMDLDILTSRLGSIKFA